MPLDLAFQGLAIASDRKISRLRAARGFSPWLRALPACILGRRAFSFISRRLAQGIPKRRLRDHPGNPDFPASPHRSSRPRGKSRFPGGLSPPPSKRSASIGSPVPENNRDVAVGKLDSPAVSLARALQIVGQSIRSSRYGATLRCRGGLMGDYLVLPGVIG